LRSEISIRGFVGKRDSEGSRSLERVLGLKIAADIDSSK
jgi:hypothetical protein